MEEAPSNLDLPSHLQMNKIPSSVMRLFKFSTLFLVFSIEVFFILYKCPPIFHLLLYVFLLTFSVLQLFLSKRPSIYLVDFSCLRPPRHCRVPISTFLENTSLFNCFDQGSIDFMAKIISSSGQSDETYLPPSLSYIPPKTHLKACIKEAEMLLFPVMDDLLSKTKISPLDIDILVLNCSAFCHAPSLTSLLVNRYAMRSDIKSFNLSGMGCSAGAISIDVAQNLLQVHENSYAIVLSAEIISNAWYPGKDRQKLLLNCLFRMGSAAILLTNGKEAKEKSKYKLVRKVRTNTASNDRSYRAGFFEEDSEGIKGFSLDRNLLAEVGECVRENVVALGKSILPMGEKLRYLISLLMKEKNVYVPNFGNVIEHYCIPTAGMAVIREVGKGLKMKEEDMEPAMMTLHRFGNQSSSSMWYEMAYMEAKGRLKKGDRVWQLWLGSGLKSASIVWECLRRLDDEVSNGPWFDCIDRYPVSFV